MFLIGFLFILCGQSAKSSYMWYEIDLMRWETSFSSNLQPPYRESSEEHGRKYMMANRTTRFILFLTRLTRSTDCNC